MKGKFKLLSIFLSITLALTFAIQVKAEGKDVQTKITYTVEGEKKTNENNKEVYANEVKVIFKVETTEDIQSVEALDDTGKWETKALTEDNVYTATTTKAGDYTFQLKVTDINGNVTLSDEVSVTIDIFKDDVEKDPIDTPVQPETPTVPEHEHDYLEGFMNMGDPIETEDGYAIIIPCSYEGCEESLELKIALYKVIAESDTYDLSQGKDLTYTIDSKGELVSVSIDDEDLIEDDEYVLNDNGTVTIKKAVLDQLDNGNHEVSFIYMEILNEDELENLDIEDPDFLSKLFKNIKMGIAFTELKVIGTKPKPSVSIDNEEEKVSPNSPVDEPKEEKGQKVNKSVKTGDDSPVVMYLGLTVMMGAALIALKRKKSA